MGRTFGDAKGSDRWPRRALAKAWPDSNAALGVKLKFTENLGDRGKQLKTPQGSNQPDAEGGLFPDLLCKSVSCGKEEPG